MMLPNEHGAPPVLGFSGEAQDVRDGHNVSGIVVYDENPTPKILNPYAEQAPAVAVGQAGFAGDHSVKPRRIRVERRFGPSQYLGTGRGFSCRLRESWTVFGHGVCRDGPDSGVARAEDGRFGSGCAARPRRPSGQGSIGRVNVNGLGTRRALTALAECARSVRASHFECLICVLQPKIAPVP